MLGAVLQGHMMDLDKMNFLALVVGGLVEVMISESSVPMER